MQRPPGRTTRSASPAVAARSAGALAERALRSTTTSKDSGSKGSAVKGDVKFWPAEGYHQDYARKNSAKYKFYRLSCRRDARLQEIWGGEATH